MKFTSDIAGYVAGVRFYKGTGNNGPHLGNLWTSGGTLLATARFQSETPNGWQEVDFPDPIPISPNTTYVASYHTNAGHYSQDLNYFATQLDSAPLHAPSSSSSGGNGVYSYGTAAVFPTQTYNASNYWVDVVFSTTAPLPQAKPTAINVSVATDTITVDDGVTFAAVFDRNQGGGISRLYDLVNDPNRTNNLGPQPQYSLFDSYLWDSQAANSQGSWGLIGGGQATTFEITNRSPESVTIHVLTPYYCEALESPNCYITDVKHESWTTVYAGGHVFFESRIITGASQHVLNNFAPASIDLCHCSNWNGIYENGGGDTAHPSGTDVYTGTGNERWWGQYSNPLTGPTLGAIEIPYQDQPFGMSYNLMRLIVGTAYLRSHVTPRTESVVTLAANTTYTARYKGWLSRFVNSGRADEMTADYRAPGFSLAVGSLSMSDSEPSTTSLASGYNPATGRYVIVGGSASNAVVGTLAFPVGVTVRYRPAFKVLNWTTAGQTVAFGGQTLTEGTDYQAAVDTAGALRVNLLFDVVPGQAVSGQRSNGSLSISPSGPALPPPPPQPPQVTAQTPVPNAGNVSVAAPVTATFNKPVNASSINFALKDQSGTQMPATVSYNASTSTATLQPSSALAQNTSYTANLSGATDSSGTVMSPLSWSFTTMNCPCTLWSPSAAPTKISTDGSAVELGVKLTSDVSGYVTGVRFYKGSGNTGTHVGNLWSASGTLLATATFANETASGWQEVSFSSPVAISANTTYVVSYHTNTGHYAQDLGYFSNGGVDSGPLHAPSNATPGGNGVYVFGSSSSFPNQTYQSSNYWVDTKFAPL